MAKAKQPGRRRGGQTSGSRMAAATPAAQTVVVEPPAPKKPRTSPMQFFSQVRAEGRKITWPSRKETWITSVMVFIMVVLAALFLWGVDFLLGLASNLILSFGQ